MLKEYCKQLAAERGGLDHVGCENCDGSCLALEGWLGSLNSMGELLGFHVDLEIIWDRRSCREDD